MVILAPDHGPRMERVGRRKDSSAATRLSDGFAQRATAVPFGPFEQRVCEHLASPSVDFDATSGFDDSQIRQLALDHSDRSQSSTV